MALTARVRLEPLTPSHAAALFAGLSDPALYQFIDDEPPVDEEVLRARYERWSSRVSPDGTQDWLNWAVWSLVEQRYVGTVQATVTRATHSAEIAYVLFRDAWGKGYAREAVALMIETLPHVRALRARVDSRNERSMKLLATLEFLAKSEADGRSQKTIRDEKSEGGERESDRVFERILSGRP